VTKVAVVGAGAMGSRISARLLDAGHQVVVWNRSQDKLAPLVAQGASPAATPREAAAGSRVLITMLADPAALRDASEGPDGIGAGAHPELVVIEMSTVGPRAVQRLASILARRAELIDAPVLGSVGEAESGDLTIFAGGPADVLDGVKPLLASLGAVVHVGPLGAGAAAKLVANAALLGTLTVLGETLALAGALDLSRQMAALALASTPLAEQARRRIPLIEAGAYPRRFALSLARKDAELIFDSCAAADFQTRALAGVRDWLRAAETEGYGEDDYTALLEVIARRPAATGTGRASTAAVPRASSSESRHRSKGTPVSPETIELVGDHVRLEPLSQQHARGLAAAAAEDPLLYRWSPVPQGVDAFRDYIETAAAWQGARTALPFAIVRVSDGTPVGSTRIWNIERWAWPEGHTRSPGADPDACEIGYTWLAASAIRTAVNTESKLLLLGLAFERWQAQRVSFHADARNARSRTALEHLGARFEGLLRAHRPAVDATPRTSARYSIVIAEWPAVKRRLRQRLAGRL
jgi:3-hydroxyisobutyrate dehydrogenase/2-hydroxy-3-oxopropionate reductase